jgi:hypothetical protein
MVRLPLRRAGADAAALTLLYSRALRLCTDRRSLSQASHRTAAWKMMPDLIDASRDRVYGRAQPHAMRHALNLSMGFGDLSTAVCVQHPDA